MKHLKKGFSLAELLIAMAIIAIIAIMGVTIARKGIENAYDGYIFTGYKSIQDAFISANADGLRIESNINNAGARVAYADIRTGSDFINKIKLLFDIPANIDDESNVSTMSVFTASNGITYRIRRISTATSGINLVYAIDIQFPTANIANPDSRRWTTVLYAPNTNYSILLPLKRPQMTDATHLQADYIDISNRRDLVLSYIDDGIAGRNINGNFTPRTFMTLNDSLCNTQGNLTLKSNNEIEIKNAANNEVPISSCNGVVTSANFPIRLIRPGKGY